MIAVKRNDADEAAFRARMLRVAATILCVAVVIVVLSVFLAQDDKQFTPLGKLYLGFVPLVAAYALGYLFISRKSHVALRTVITLLIGAVVWMGAVVLHLAGHPFYQASYSDAQYEKDRQAAEKSYTGQAAVNKQCQADSKENTTGFRFFKAGDQCVGVRSSSTFWATVYSKGEVAAKPGDDVYAVVFPAGQETSILEFDPQSDAIQLSKAEAEDKLDPNQRHWLLEHVSG